MNASEQWKMNGGSGSVKMEEGECRAECDGWEHDGSQRWECVAVTD